MQIVIDVSNQEYTMLCEHLNKMHPKTPSIDSFLLQRIATAYTRAQDGKSLMAKTVLTNRPIPFGSGGRGSVS